LVLLRSGCAVLWACCWRTRVLRWSYTIEETSCQNAVLFITTLSILSGSPSFPPCHTSTSIHSAHHITIPQICARHHISHLSTYPSLSRLFFLCIPHNLLIFLTLPFRTTVLHVATFFLPVQTRSNPRTTSRARYPVHRCCGKLTVLMKMLQRGRVLRGEERYGWKIVVCT
jgi:hypothetical protein